MRSRHLKHLENNHEYAEPYCAVPTPRCLLDDSPLSGEPMLSNRPTSDYSTVKRSPSRGEGHFVDLGPGKDFFRILKVL
ncbi:hypothetical protein AVEN_85504-1 [Araneus ventricosus]|uniref:Uncharacterized protein n=1 Tax=Araneus ventricosus TaxID=182803 RepID=A0A4Y2K952_ARAVE|nr:hypothetical protein AVEN_85504-1 [Araneus ventricosus]